MSFVDLVLIALALLFALSGFRRGLLVSATSIVGFVVGAVVGGAVGEGVGRRPAAAWTAAIVLAAMAALVGLNFPQPGWASIGMVVAALLGGLLANHLVETRDVPRSEAGTPPEPVDES